MWVYILCIASKKNSPKVILYTMHAEKIGRFNAQTISSALEKLNDIKVITFKHVTHTGRTRRAHDALTVRSRTLRDETRRDGTKLLGSVHAQDPETDLGINLDIDGQVLDFEAIYKIYPQRRGSQRKADGIRVCENKIKTIEQYENMKRAVENYGAHCKSEKKIGTEFVSQFKTFVGSIWEEWINPLPLPPKGNGIHPVTKAQSLQQENDAYLNSLLSEQGALGEQHN